MAWLRDYKLARGCADCGHRGHPSGCDLDIDHTAGKTFSVAHMRSPATIQAEIERHACVVRCANCHRIKTWKEKQHD